MPTGCVALDKRSPFSICTHEAAAPTAHTPLFRDAGVKSWEQRKREEE